MKDASSVFSQATDGIGVKLAKEMEVSTGRLYEILGKDCPWPKTKKLIRAIGHVDDSPAKDRVRLIKADADAMFADILGVSGDAEMPTVQVIHKEAFEAVNAMIDGKSWSEQLKELRDLQAAVSQKIEGVERQMMAEQCGGVRAFAKNAVKGRAS